MSPLLDSQPSITYVFRSCKFVVYCSLLYVSDCHACRDVCCCISSIYGYLQASYFSICVLCMVLYWWPVSIVKIWVSFVYYVCLVFLYFLIRALTLSHISWYILFQADSDFTNVSLLNGSQIVNIASEYLLMKFIIHKKDLGGGISVSTCSFCGSDCTPHLDIISPKIGMLI